jgi:threonylcarbamoyladenosine tRNA methylthiotransferase MtaB
MMATLKTITLGCKVNQYETQLVREGLLRVGYTDADNEASADLCVVNTCTVTAEGDAKSRQTIRKLSRLNPQTRVVVMGCYATRAPEEVASLPNVVEVVTDKREIPDLLGRFGVVDIPDGIGVFSGHHRAFVKIQDGCLLRCSYCIIPHVRPQMVSRDPASIEAEIWRLVDAGYQEIVLTGIHLGHYGVDRNQGEPKSRWVRLSHLIQRLVTIPGKFRLRLSSIEATEVTRELVDTIAEHTDKVTPHLHVCLQSGSDRILHKMNRRWGAKRFVDRCLYVQEELDTPALSTDIIVGFPGETEEDFEATLQVARDCGFMKIHAFPFSPRKGTPAANMGEMVPSGLKSERMQRLTSLECNLRDDYAKRLIGTSLEVLPEIEAEADCFESLPPSTLLSTYLQGTACRYLPVVFSGDKTQLGKLLRVIPTDYAQGKMIVRSSSSRVRETDYGLRGQ